MNKIQINKYCFLQLLFSLLLLIAPGCPGVITAYYKARWHSFQLAANPNDPIHLSYQSGKLPYDIFWRLLRLKTIQNFLQSHNEPDYWVLALAGPKTIYSIDLHFTRQLSFHWLQPDDLVTLFFHQNRYALNEIKGLLTPEQSTVTTRQIKIFDWHHPKAIQYPADNLSFLVLEFVKQSSGGLSAKEINQGLLINHGVMQDVSKRPWFYLTDWLLPAFTVDIEQDLFSPSAPAPAQSEMEETGSQQEELLIQIILENGEETNCVIPRFFFEHMSRSDRINANYWLGMLSGEMRVSAGTPVRMSSLCQQIRQDTPQTVRQLASSVETIIVNLHTTQESQEQNANAHTPYRTTIVVPDNEESSPVSQKKEQTGSSAVAQESTPGISQFDQLSIAKVNQHQLRLNEPEKEKPGTESVSTPALLPVKPDVVIHQVHKTGTLLHLPLGKGSVVQTIGHGVVLHIEAEYKHLNLITPMGIGYSITSMTTSGQKSEPFHFRTQHCQEVEAWLPTNGALFIMDEMSGIVSLKVTVIAEEDKKAELFRIRESNRATHKEQLQPEKRIGQNRLEYSINVFSESLQLQLKNGQFCIEETRVLDYMGHIIPGHSAS